MEKKKWKSGKSTGLVTIFQRLLLINVIMFYYVLVGIGYDFDDWWNLGTLPWRFLHHPCRNIHSLYKPPQKHPV